MQKSIIELFPFQLDNFQLEAIAHLEEGKSVVVCAPTGAGKTAIAEYAVERALDRNQRCYYTTPLKALSNQKFHDLRSRYGEEKVGLLTGDTSINRDAAVVVMTTEVFRNMLYGTILGDISRNLYGVSFVVLDECHYMNDAERGTVWEESIIYAPKGIQLIALSATIANAAELTTWINETHGPTSLIVSDFRPVPLRFYYFGDRQIYPLLSQGGSLNGLLKGRFGSRKFAHKQHLRKSINSHIVQTADVLALLSARNMLPCIYFLFSRRGCEEAMKKARGIPLLQLNEQAQLHAAVEAFIKDNPNLKNHPHLTYLLEGMSVHHAGMLPSWKSMIEKLFQKGLLKVVFATETLAAGINMPARSTVISSTYKRSDEGHRQLNASEFLQMSGRAGRRGMDAVGNVVILHHQFEPIEEVAKLANSPADPLVSQFTPSYSMVLNLLQRHTLEETRDLIEHSFGQFIISLQLKPLYSQVESWKKEHDDLLRPLCPTEIGDLALYAKRLEGIKAKHKQLKQMEHGLKKNDTRIRSLSDHESAELPIKILRDEINSLLIQAYSMPCHGCPVQKPCGKQTQRIAQLEKRIKEYNRRIDREKTKHWRTFEALANILRTLGYLNGNTPTKLGRMAAGIRGTNELFLAEVALSNKLNDLGPAELGSVLTALVGEESRLLESMQSRLNPAVALVLDEIYVIKRKLWKLQKDFEVEIPIRVSTTFCPLTEMWIEGATWDEMRLSAMCDEGDIVRALRRTLDLARQFMRAEYLPDKLIKLCREVEALIARDEIQEAL